MVVRAVVFQHNMELDIEAHLREIDNIVRTEGVDGTLPDEWQPQDSRHILEEMSKRLTDLKNRDMSLKAEVKTLKEKYKICEMERLDRKKDLEKLKKDDEVVTKKLNKMKKEVASFEYTIHKTEEKMKPTSKDQSLLNHQSHELSCYGRLTGIRWDFTAPDHILAGLHTNMVTKAVRVFEYDTRAQSIHHISNSLWSCLEECATKGWIESENMENKSDNGT